MAIVIETVSDSKQAQQDLSKLKQSVENIQTSVESATSAFTKLGTVLTAGFAAYSTISGVLRLSDAFTTMETRLQLVTKSQEDFLSALKETQKIAINTRTDLDSVTTLYSKLSRSASQFGASQAQIATVTKLVSQSLAINNGSLQEANSTILQFGQALASGKLSGDELRSILENAPPLAEQIAKGLGKSVGELRKLGEAGELSAVKVFKAILKQQDEINTNFGKVRITYASAFLNLKTSFLILGNTISRTFFTSTSSFADSINNVAKSVFSFATNFNLYVLNARVNFTNFIFESILLILDFWEYLKETPKKFSDIANNISEVLLPTISIFFIKLKEVSVNFYKSASDALQIFFSYLTNNNFIQSTLTTLNQLVNKVFIFFTESFSRLSSNLPSIDISKIFPGLDAALIIVKNWVKEAERAFFWLYDKVIGNSWIPDLVNSATYWLSLLTKKPLSFIKEFVLKANLQFAGIKINAPLLAGIGILAKYKTALFSIIAIVKTLGIALQTSLGQSLVESGKNFINNLKENLSKRFKVQAEPTVTNNIIKESKSKNTEPRNKFLETAEKTYKNIKDIFDSSVFGRTTKQVLGIQDKVPGQVFGTTIDNNSQVGRGPQRNYSDRTLFHDIINAFPSDWQMPIIATVTTAITAAIALAFEGKTRMVLISVFTTLAAIFTARVVQSSDIKKFFENLAFNFVSIIEKGITSLFDGNVLKDPLGLLSVIAKTALLFEAGRKYILNALKNIAIAPTGLANTVSDRVRAKLLERSIENTNKTLSQFPNNLGQQVRSANSNVTTALSNLANSRDSSGNLIGTRRAADLLTSRDINQFGASNRALAQQVLAASNTLSQVNQQRTQRNDLIDNNKRSQEQLKALNERFAAQGQAFRDGFRNIGAGAGGIIGGVAGFQIGAEIARGMENSPAWVKIATTLGVSFVGQVIGAGIGNLLASSIIGAAGLAGTLMGRAFLALNPYVRIAAAIGAALYAGYIIFKNLPADWKEGLKGLLTAAPNSMGDNLKKSTNSFERGLVQQALKEQTPEDRKAVLDSNETLIAAIGKLSTTLEDWLRKNFPTSSNPVVTKATGGWISGPGTATSDSIPAMLSNGEFVVNAKDAAKNWDILTAINSGKEVKKFSQGTQELRYPTEFPKEGVKIVTDSKLSKSISDFTGEFKSSFEKFTNILTNALGFNNSDNKTPKTTIPTPTGFTEEKTFKDYVENLKDSTKAFDKIAEKISSVGFKDLDLKALKELPTESLNIVLNTLSAIDRKQSILAKSPQGSLVQKSITESLDNDRRDLLKALKEFNIKVTKPTNLTETPEQKKPTPLTFGDQFRIVSALLPKFDLNLEEFQSLPDTLRESIFSSALEITRGFETINSKEIGKLETGPTAKLNVQDKLKQLNDQAKVFADSAESQLKAFRSRFKFFQSIFKDLGINITEEVAANISNGQESILSDLAQEAKKQYDLTRKPIGQITTAELQAAQKKLEELVKKINLIVRDVNLTEFDKLKRDLSEFNIDLNQRAFNLLTDIERTTITEYLSSLKSIKITPEMTEEQRKTLQERLDQLTKDILTILQTKAPDFKTQTQMAGEALADSAKEGFTNSLAEFVKNRKTFSEASKDFLNSFTNSIVDTFVKGLVESIAGKDSPLMKNLSSIAGGVFDLGKSVGPSPANPNVLTEPPVGILGSLFGGKKASDKSIKAETGLQEPPGSEVENSFSSIIDNFKNAWNNIDFGDLFNSFTDAFKNIDFGALLQNLGQAFSSVIKFLGFAEGGQVLGVGTATSDSIPAMLSNGEFVVNAKATANNLKLLQAINSGRFRKFAEGGLVSTAMIATPVFAEIPSKDNTKSNISSQQVFNINITGDISRQTRAEIYGMLPNIAESVNAHNREKGYKG